MVLTRVEWCCHACGSILSTFFVLIWPGRDAARVWGVICVVHPALHRFIASKSPLIGFAGSLAYVRLLPCWSIAGPIFRLHGSGSLMRNVVGFLQCPPTADLGVSPPLRWYGGIRSEARAVGIHNPVAPVKFSIIMTLPSWSWGTSYFASCNHRD